MKRVMIGVFFMAFLVGLTLLTSGGWPLLIIGLASIACGYAYTGGPYPLGYNGLGDLFVFIFFGLVAVGATYFVQAEVVSGDALLLGAGIGALAANILVVNNYRDVETDVVAGKRTLVVRWGRGYARCQFVTAHGLAVLVLIALGWAEWHPLLLGLSVVVCVGLGWLQSRRLANSTTPAALIVLLGQTGLYLAGYALLVSAGLIWG
jgi:1,4-dihydroxy-2-naphthoate octaprenyltransferase